MWTLRVLWLCPLLSLVSPCPTGCCCPGASSLVLCESLGLRSLPRSVPLTTSALSVARNQLCDVDHQFSAFAGLLDLSLGHNLLSRFPRGLPSSLESLQLQENRIVYIPSGALRKLRNLMRLDLEENRIRVIQPGALQGLNKLQVLTLKGNKLTGLPRSLPPSLTHLDLSENCISVLDTSSLSSLVNLQSLKINRNCLGLVPGSALASLAGLRSVELTNNVWACRCAAPHLYRWLLRRRLRMATDMCTELSHLARHTLMNLSVMEICPHVLWSRERQDLDLTREGGLVTFNNRTPFENASRRTSKATGFRALYPNEYYSLENISYEKCVSLTKTQTDVQNVLKTTLSLSVGQQKFSHNTLSHYPDVKATSAQALVTTQGSAARTTALPRAHTQPHSALVVPLLAFTCVLLFVLTLMLLMLLKKVLLRQRRVAPLNVRSGS